MTKITEEPSSYRNLEQRTIAEITTWINQEDKTVALAVEKALPQIQALIQAIVDKLRQGGRLFYVGAGSGGRLSVLDVIELPTTFGIEKGLVNAVLAGGVARLADALSRGQGGAGREKERPCHRHEVGDLPGEHVPDDPEV